VPSRGRGAANDLSHGDRALHFAFAISQTNVCIAP
jgi:hypothetical protein